MQEQVELYTKFFRLQKVLVAQNNDMQKNKKLILKRLKILAELVGR